MKKTKKHNEIPNLHPKFFWDFNFDKIDWDGGYKMVIARIVERGGQDQIDKIVRFYGREKVITAVRDEIYFLPNYAIEDALKFFPELKKEEMYCYLNRKDKPYHWI
ncbi:DUF6922 domain-containing protein [Flavobacterium aquicola]|uniref:DUF6922 domain-containing protein n=1 Tax=Flavobacterium aquicola TaxID=1682742 RepID=A0A3E0E720_9FLAO|nr:hypothetical protein [Flavobacterium aquicola]REG94048.1 hypothetical protein C8P67_11313 [Flavobacterium aquicola]